MSAARNASVLSFSLKTTQFPLDTAPERGGGDRGRGRERERERERKRDSERERKRGRVTVGESWPAPQPWYTQRDCERGSQQPPMKRREASS
jgi:hypothetical protein